ncbi:MAG TPA: choice-of-anchor P family protein [Gemmatimonadales bacterium]|nr:choice-of-anchor P family protein [Gemmatimonadales bacterium]
MNRLRWSSVCCGTAVLVLAVLAAWPPPGAAQSQQVIGQATALRTSVAGLLGTTTVEIASTGPLANAADARQASEPAGTVAGLGGAEVLVATTISSISTWAPDDAVASAASLADLAVTVLGIRITAAFVMAEAQATVGGLTAGAVSLDGLTANGMAIPVTGAPNQMVSLPGLQLIINEVTRSAGGITVNALHITTLTGAIDVVAGSATAGVR